MKKECLIQTWLGGSLRYYFTLFSDMSDNFTKNYLWSFLSSSFSNSLNMKKDWVVTVVKIIKT